MEKSLVDLIIVLSLTINLAMMPSLVMMMSLLVVVTLQFLRFVGHIVVDTTHNTSIIELSRPILIMIRPIPWTELSLPLLSRNLLPVLLDLLIPLKLLIKAFFFVFAIGGFGL